MFPCRKKKREDAIEHHVDKEKEDEQGKRFIARLLNYDQLKKRQRKDEHEYVQLLRSFEEQSAEKVRESFDLWKNVCTKLVRYCRGAAFENCIPLKQERLEFLMVKESNKYEQVRRVRTASIRLGHQIERLKLKIREKNADVDDVSLIGHEQMKLEIYHMFERLQDRNREIECIMEAVRKYAIRTSHIREKSQMQRAQNEEMREKRQKVDDNIQEARRKINLLKCERDKIRNRNAKLQKKVGLLQFPLLISDYEVTHDSINDARNRISTLRGNYLRTDEKRRRVKKRIRSVEPMKKSNFDKLPLIFT